MAKPWETDRWDELTLTEQLVVIAEFMRELGASDFNRGSPLAERFERTCLDAASKLRDSSSRSDDQCPPSSPIVTDWGELD